MKSVWMGVVVGGMLFTQLAYGLPPEHETRRLMLAVEKAVDDENWGEAGEYLNRLQTLETQKPDDYAYFRGRVMYEAGHLNEAMSALETYVTQAGTEGEHYNDSLELITTIEQTRKKGGSAQASEANGDPVATIEPAGGDSVQDLQRLYLAKTPLEALERHANSLLSQNAWRAGSGEKIVRAEGEPDVQYRVSATAGQLQVQETRKVEVGRSEVVSNPLPVYGINPLLDWDCLPAERTCFIYDPRDGSRWIKLGGQEATTEELARTLGDMIRRLQSPS